MKCFLFNFSLSTHRERTSVKLGNCLDCTPWKDTLAKIIRIKLLSTLSISDTSIAVNQLISLFTFLKLTHWLWPHLVLIILPGDYLFTWTGEVEMQWTQCPSWGPTRSHWQRNNDVTWCTPSWCTQCSSSQGRGMTSFCLLIIFVNPRPR